MIRVLVVEDEAITANAHEEYVRRIDGFALAGSAATGAEAILAIRAGLATGETIDLVLLDMNLPDIGGIELCRRIRAAGLDVDVIAITAVRDIAVVRASVAAGIVQYLIKPFAFGVFAAKLASYRDYRERIRGTAGIASQNDVDGAFAALRTSNAPGLPKGLSPETLDAVSVVLRAVANRPPSDSPNNETDSRAADPATDDVMDPIDDRANDDPGVSRASLPGVSAGEIAAHLDIARVTARRYLEYLADSGLADRAPRYGAPGRPELEYRWRTS